MTSGRARPPSGAMAFLEHEATGGLALLGAGLAALLISNSPLAWLYDSFLDTRLGVRMGQLAVDKPLLLWINEGLMATFFLLVGLEIKRETLRGELSSLGRAALPVVAAIGGMGTPAAIYALLNLDDPVALRGWAIPTATDIAFAVGVLALLGDRVPSSLKLFLLAVAIIDDLGAIVIIAAFYTVDLHWTALVLAAAGCLALALYNALGITRLAPYLLTGIFIWVCVLKSGVHATLAGVAVAMAIPLSDRRSEGNSPLEQLEEALHPWVAFGVLPLFAFANAGVSLQGLSAGKLLDRVPLGIALGLLIGKPLGIFTLTWFAVVSGLTPKPAGARWLQVFGVSMVAGIGFTMSLFIGTLAFVDATHAVQARLGVLGGSLLSAVCGLLVLILSAQRRPALRE